MYFPCEAGVSTGSQWGETGSSGLPRRSAAPPCHRLRVQRRLPRPQIRVLQPPLLPSHRPADHALRDRRRGPRRPRGLHQLPVRPRHPVRDRGGENGLVRLRCRTRPPRPCTAPGGTARRSTRTDRFTDAFDTESREWIAGLAAGEEPTGPSAWDGCAATAITDATDRSMESGQAENVDMKPRPDRRCPPPPSPTPARPRPPRDVIEADMTISPQPVRPDGRR